MKTTCQNEQVVSLINRSFDSDGMIVRKGSRKAQKEAREILASNEGKYSNDASRTYGENDTVNGYDVHGSLLILAYPARQI